MPDLHPLLKYPMTFLLLITCFAGMGQQPYSPEIVNPLTEPWRWRQFPALEGKGVSFIAEDREGKVWFGFNDGILCYDGYQWQHHDENNGLIGSPVQQILASNNGNLYATTSSGLYILKGETWEALLTPPESLVINYTFLKEDSKGHIYLGSSYGVFQIRENEIVRCFTSPTNVEALAEHEEGINFVLFPDEALESNTFLEITDCLEDNTGLIWFAIGFEEGGTLLRFDPSTLDDKGFREYSLFNDDSGISFGEGQKLIQTQDDEIWVVNTSVKLGINVYDGRSWTQINLSEKFGGDEYATDIIQTDDGTIWIGSLGKLFAFTGDKWHIYKSPAFKIPANKLMLFLGSNEKIWIGSFKAKAYLLDYSKERWTTYRNLNFQCESADGTKYFLEVSGRIVTEKENQWHSYGVEDGLITSPVRIIATSRDQIWVAGSEDGYAATAYLKENSWHRQVHKGLSWGIDYRAVFEAMDGSLWFGGAVDIDRSKGHFGGVLQLRNPLEPGMYWLHHKYHENGLNQSNAYGIAQSEDGRIWLGGGSLMMCKGKQWQKADQAQLQQFVNIVHSKDGLLAVGSRYYGVYLYDGNTWRQYNTDSGLASNSIFSLYMESPTRIWAATENDISLFDGESWVNFVFPTEMNMNFEGGSLQGSADGSLWVNKSLREWKRRAFSFHRVSEEIYNNFITYRYIPDKTPPETEFELYTEKLAYKGNNLVTWKGEDFFGSTPTERITYSYRINDGEWSPFSRDLQHRFLSLAAGNNTMEVRARDMDFNIDPTPASIEFKVVAPVWRQAWFIILILAFLITIGIFEFRIISKKQKLEKLNSSLHKINTELQTNKQQIEFQNEEILKQQQQIIIQKQALEKSYANLQEQNLEIQDQKDKLEEMVTQVEELSKSKINFFTNISHELRTPLSLILGPIQQLKDPTYDLLEREKSELRAIIERNAYLLLKLINQLLEMRRIEQSTLELKLSRVDLVEFLAEITSLFQNLAKERKITLDFIPAEDTVDTLIDPDKVEKILTNLLSNAFKNTPEGGRITVSLSVDNLNPMQEVSDDSFRKYFRIDVVDTGTGIKDEHLRQIFDRYFRLSDDRFSSGIGLSYIKDLVTIHQGHISVDSTFGKGTSFSIYIPEKIKLCEEGIKEEYDGDALLLEFTESEAQFLLGLSKPETQDRQTESPLNGKTPTILIIEDNLDMLSFLDGILSRRYHIIKALNGMEGLQLATKHNPDMILTDIMMPEMDGLEFTGRIKTELATSHIPVILLTAKSLDDNILEGYTVGADDYMTKPFNPTLLETRVANLLLQRQQLREKFTRDILTSPKEIKLHSPDEALLQKLVEIMEANIDEAEFNVNKMCDMVNLSHTHFIRKVKQLTGKKPVDLLKSFRLQRAKDLLQQNKANIAEVAYMVGYNLPNSFSRAFKKEFGVSPTEFVEGGSGDSENQDGKIREANRSV